MKLVVGGKYVSQSGRMVRVIERIDGNDVYWRDDYGPGICRRSTFHKWVGKIYDKNEHKDSALPIPPPLPPKMDRRATDEVLEIILHIQNQMRMWRITLEQALQHRQDILLSTQKEVLKSAIGHCLSLEKHLEPCRDELIK